MDNLVSEGEAEMMRKLMVASGLFAVAMVLSLDVQVAEAGRCCRNRSRCCGGYNYGGGCNSCGSYGNYGGCNSCGSQMGGCYANQGCGAGGCPVPMGTAAGATAAPVPNNAPPAPPPAPSAATPAPAPAPGT